MPSLKDLKTRIDSVKSTRKITKAMQMVAASKLRRAQQAAEASRPYAQRMEAVISALGSKVVRTDATSPLLAGTGKDDVHLVVVATSDRGLCGGFNASIVKAARARIEDLLADGKTVKIMTLGRKAHTMLRRLYKDRIIDRHDFAGVKAMNFEVARTISDNVLTRFGDGEFDVAWLFFARFRSVLTQEVTEQQLIPVAVAQGAQAQGADAAVYEYEPDEEAILREILPRNVAIQIFSALLENAASEEGARMTAMDAATRNAGEMIDKLTLTFNRTRQAIITKELIEIISGAEAL